MPHTYLLKHGPHQRLITSSGVMARNEVVRIAKPADDRSSRDGFRLNPDDYETWRVVDVAAGHIERPDGGFDEIRIVTLQREYPDEQPQPLTPGG
jgi:hypothetical protein